MKKYFTLTNQNPLLSGKTYYFRHQRTGAIFPAGPRESYLVQKMHQLVGVSDGKTFLQKWHETFERQEKDLEALIKLKEGSAKWRVERTRIAKQAEQGLKEAFKADLEASKGKMESIPDMRGKVEGARNNATDQKLQNLLSRL
jgi:hypothetical protein